MSQTRSFLNESVKDSTKRRDSFGYYIGCFDIAGERRALERSRSGECAPWCDMSDDEYRKLDRNSYDRYSEYQGWSLNCDNVIPEQDTVNFRRDET